MLEETNRQNMTTIAELESEYVAKHARSKQLYERAKDCYASGVTHDSRFVHPFPIYADRARGTRKWDVDGNEYVDYVMGHGALVLGYGDERVDAAFQEQIPKAIHMGASTELEIEWAELIKKLVPCARDGFVRPASSGTEANLLAIRMCRIYTDRPKIVLHAGCYHGTADTTIYASRGPPYGLYNTRGIPKGLREDVIILPYNNLPLVEETFAKGDVACILLQGNDLYTRDYIEGLRKLTHEYGVVFLMDEVVSGFRYALGGAQEYYGVTPDLATLGKVIGGGAPVGAICGRRDIMEAHAFKDDNWNRFVRISAGGTWNAQPITIAGGIAMMKALDEEQATVYPRLRWIGRRLTGSFNDQAHDLGITALATGLPFENPTQFSVHLLNRPIPEDLTYLWQTGPTELKNFATKASFCAGSRASHVNYLVTANSGVYPFPRGSYNTCARYTEEDLVKTEAAFGDSLRALRENGLIGSLK
jgi:glutamate-1-semialdehyde 2,1-aminomutase